MIRPVLLVAGFVVLTVQASVCSAHVEMGKALKAKYKFRSASCYTCHSRKKDVAEADHAAYKENAKAFRNSFGDSLAKLLEGKEVTKRMAEIKELKKGDPKKVAVVDDVVEQFLEALEEAEAEESPDGPTYGEALEAGTLDGVKKRKR